MRMDSGAEAVEINPSLPATAAVILLHGLGADGNDLAALAGELTPFRQDRVRFVFPHAPFRPVTVNGGYVMRAWYDIRSPDLSRAQDEGGILASVESLHGLIHDQIASGIPSRRIIIGGFSQGGAIALYGGLCLALRLGGILALSTYVPLAHRLQGDAAAADPATPVMMAHGTEDPIVPVAYGRLSRRQVESLGYTVRWHEYAMGHTICEEEIRDIAAWLGATLDQ